MVQGKQSLVQTVIFISTVLSIESCEGIMVFITVNVAPW